MVAGSCFLGMGGFLTFPSLHGDAHIGRNTPKSPDIGRIRHQFGRFRPIFTGIGRKLAKIAAQTSSAYCGRVRSGDPATSSDGQPLILCMFLAPSGMTWFVSTVIMHTMLLDVAEGQKAQLMLRRQLAETAFDLQRVAVVTTQTFFQILCDASVCLNSELRLAELAARTQQEPAGQPHVVQLPGQVAGERVYHPGVSAM